MSEPDFNPPNFYKIIVRVVEVPDPLDLKSEGKAKHVTWPCRIYKVGDKMTFNPLELLPEETDAVCQSALIGMMGYMRLWTHGVYPMSGWYGKPPKEIRENGEEVIGSFECPDKARPVKFEVCRISADFSEKFPSYRSPDTRPDWDKW